MNRAGRGVLWTLGVVTFLGILVTVGAWIFSDKKISMYYTSIDAGRTNTTCIYAYRQWAPDERCFCSDDINKVVDVLAKFNAARTR